MKNLLSRLASPVLVMLLSVGAVVAVAPAASATHEGGFTARELLQMCNAGKTDRCAFKPSGRSTSTGEALLVGAAQNCGSGTDRRLVRWEASYSTKISIGFEVTAKQTIGKSFEATYKASFGAEWAWTDTKVDEYTAFLGPKVRKEIYASKLRTNVRGDYEINFGKRQKGHYVWYVRGIEIVGPTKGSAWDITARQVKNTC